MKTYRSLLYLATCFSLIFSACQKDSAITPNTNPIDNSGGGTATTKQTGTIEITNNTPTALRISINGVPGTKALGLRSTMTISGEAGQPANIIVETDAKDALGNPIGLTLTMNELFSYPEAGQTIQQPINIPSDVYFVYATNNASAPIDELVINRGLPTEMSSVVNIPNNGRKIACGYYPAPDGFTYIKAIQNKGGANEWNFDDIKLAGQENQTVTVDIY
jgi:hypothetical protein